MRSSEYRRALRSKLRAHHEVVGAMVNHALDRRDYERASRLHSRFMKIDAKLQAVRGDDPPVASQAARQVFELGTQATSPINVVLGQP